MQNFGSRKDFRRQFNSFATLQFSYAISGGWQPGLEIWDPETGNVELLLHKWGGETNSFGLAKASMVSMPGKLVLFSKNYFEEL